MQDLFDHSADMILQIYVCLCEYKGGVRGPPIKSDMVNDEREYNKLLGFLQSLLDVPYAKAALLKMGHSWWTHGQ